MDELSPAQQLEQERRGNGSATTAPRGNQGFIGQTAEKLDYVLRELSSGAVQRRPQNYFYTAEALHLRL